MKPTVSNLRGSKDERYRALTPQIKALLDGESDVIAALGNVAAALKMTFEEYNWAGFYLLRGDSAESSQLVLGPFQGKPACTRIKVGQGVCGKSIALRQTIVVPDVSEFPGHIYCDPDSRSEIVVPMLRGPEALGVLDIDSDRLDAFDDVDRVYLEEIVREVVRKF